MKTVKDLLKKKGADVWSIAPDATVYDAIKLMAEKRIGALLVLENDRLCGIVTERDYARKVILAGKSSRETKVSDIMSTKVYYVQPNQDINSCMALITEKAIRHLPVLENEKLVGVISIGDVVKSVISEQEFIIEQLETYITGR